MDKCQFDGNDCCDNDIPGWDQYCNICECKSNTTNNSTTPSTTPSTITPTSPTIPPLICGEDHYGPSGIIQSPGYPEHYPAKARCNWNISCEDERSKVQITFDSFMVEEHPECL